MALLSGILVYRQQNERVQRRILNFAGFKLNIAHLPHDYGPVLRGLNLESRTDSRLAHDLSLLLNLINGKTHSFDV